MNRPLLSADFEVYEDGVRQEIATMTLVTPDGPSEGGGSVPAVTSPSAGDSRRHLALIGPSFIALYSTA